MIMQLARIIMLFERQNIHILFQYQVKKGYLYP